MKKINKKTIIYIVIIMCIIIGYYLFTREEQYVENIYTITTFEENIQKDNILKSEIEKEENNIIIHLSGAVKNQGIYKLKKGSRIADSIELAGGLTEDAQINNINLAYILEDGMKIHIPSKNEKINEIQDNTNQYISKENSNLQSQKNIDEKININTATQTELETLPGIGPSTALKIVNYRKENGKFKTIEDIKEISGIGESKFEQIKNFIKI